MKKYLLILTALLSLLGCSREDINKNGEPPTPDGTVKMTVRFPGRTLAAPTTYAGTYPADASEKSLSNVRIYVFSDKAGQPDKLLGTEVVTAVSAGDTEAGVTGTFFMRYFGKLHLVATANLSYSADDIRKMGGIDFATFSKSMVTQPAGVPDAFAMVSEPVVADVPNPNTGAVAPAVSFLLERLSARIDIENLTTADGGVFILSGARLRIAIDRSFLVKGQSPALEIGKEGAVELPGLEWTENKGVGGDMKKMYMQLYAYENVANTLVVEVKGTYKGVPAQFRLPFGAKEVKRNTRYVVQVRNITGNKVDFDITVKDWDEGGDIPFQPGIDGTRPRVVAIEATNAAGATAPTAHTLTYSSGSDPDKATAIKLNNPTLYHTKITVESPSVESMILVNKAELPWLTVKEIGESGIEGGKLRQTFLITYGATMDRYARTATLEIQNKFKPDKVHPHLITVTQPGNTASTMLLARLANANVDALNTFATAITPDNVASPEVMGKLYQWGRNVPFDYTVKPTVVTTRATNPNDPVIWSNSYITPTSAPYNWLANAAAVESWASLVNKSTSAPASYKGTNGGDPSPKGWRVPTADEYGAIFASNLWDEINLKGKVNKLDVAEKLTLGGVTADYTADYYSQTQNVIYALKMKGNGNTQLTAYRYESKANQGLWVTARHLGVAGATTTVQTVATEDFWATNAGSDVIRYFPRGGRLYSESDNDDVLMHARGVEGHYWSATSMNVFSAYHIVLSFWFANRSDIYHRDYGLSLRPISD